MNSYENITQTRAKALIQEGATLADIRDKASFDSAHINHAFHLTNDNIQDFIRDNDLDKPLIVYCYHGHSSQQAADFLHQQGFEQVYSLIGGYTEWQDN